MPAHCSFSGDSLLPGTTPTACFGSRSRCGNVCRLCLGGLGLAASLAGCWFALGVTAESRLDRQVIRHVAALGGTVTVSRGALRGNQLAVSFRRMQVADADLDCLSAWFKLTWLDLYGTGITDVGLAHLQGLKQLEYLNLAATSISDAGLVHLQGLKNLEVLALGPRITDKGLAHLHSLPRLHTLFAGDTAICGSGFAESSRWRSLKSLWLERSQLDDAGVRCIAALPALERLNLSGTRLTDAGVPWLLQLQGLDYLGLADTAISDRGGCQLAALPQLFLLELPGTQVSEQAVRELEQQLPGAYVVH